MAAALEGLTVEPSSDGFTARLVLSGEVDVATAPMLEEHIALALDDGCTDVVLDCGGLEFIDSSGLSVLVVSHQRLEANGGQLIIEAAPPAARRLFDISGLDQLLTIR